MSEPIAQLVLFYLVYALMAAAICVWVLRMRRFVLVVVLLLPFLAYVPVEVRTALYGAEFRGVKPDTGWEEFPLVYFRVFSTSNDEAALFCVQGRNGRHEVGDMYAFRKVHGRWVYSDRA